MSQISSVEKKYDFFSLHRHTNRAKKPKGYDNDGNSYDMSGVDKALLERFTAGEADKQLIKMSNSIYVGITNIRCIDLQNDVPFNNENLDLNADHLWIFNIERANVQNKAVIVKVQEDVKSGRKEYGGDPSEGAATDTVICFNPINGVVVIPPRAGVGILLLKKYFYRITNPRVSGLWDDIVRDSTSAKNAEHLSAIKEIDFRVANVVDDKVTQESGIGLYNDVKNQKMAIKLYGGNIDVQQAVRHIKALIGLKENNKLDLEKVLIDGEHNQTHQLIDLVNNRMIASDNVSLVNGKVTIDSMMDSAYRAYKYNKTKLDISHSLKGGKGV